MNACASGRELIEKGYAQDIAWSADLDTSTVVPGFREDAYVNAVT